MRIDNNNKMPVTLKVKDNKLIFNDNTVISFQRTLRIPQDDKIYPLPPSFGYFPVCRVDDYLDKVPESWKKHGGVFIPMYQREAMWVQFEGKSYDPKACKIAVGKVNAINGKTWNQSLDANDQDYVVIPDQPWLDGINAGDGHIKQFVAMPLGQGYTVEAQVTGKEEFGGIQIIVYDAKPQRKQPQPQPPVYTPPIVYPQPIPPPVYPPAPQPMYGPQHPSPVLFSAQSAPAPKMLKKKMAAPVMLESEQCKMEESAYDSFSFDNVAAELPAAQPQGLFNFSAVVPTAPSAVRSESLFAPAPPPVFQQQQQQQQERRAQPKPQQQAKEMGLAAGGKMKQKIYEDKHGATYWDENNFARVFVHIVNSAMYEQITGKKPPETPVDASAYTNFGYPWFDIYDENAPSVKPSTVLQNVKSVKEIDQQKFAWPQQDDSTVHIPSSQVKTVLDKNAVRDGDW
jgi:hypothetical protein